MNTVYQQMLKLTALTMCLPALLACAQQPFDHNDGFLNRPKSDSTASPNPNTTASPSSRPTVQPPKVPVNVNPSLILGKTEKDVIAKRESYIYRLALPNADFSKMIYSYNTTEEVDFNDSYQSSARRIVKSGLWLFDRATGKNEKLPESLQFDNIDSSPSPIYWIDHNRALGVSSHASTDNLNESALVILDFAKRSKTNISTANDLSGYFIQGNFVYYLVRDTLFKYDLQSEQSTSLALPPANTDMDTSTYFIRPYVGEQILIAKTKPNTLVGKYDFSLKTALPPPGRPLPMTDYYIFDTRNSQATLVHGAVDIESWLFASTNLLFSPSFLRYAVFNAVFDGDLIIPIKPNRTPYLWITDKLLLSVVFEADSYGIEQKIKSVYIDDTYNFKTIFESSFPSPCQALYKAEHNRILAACSGQVMHLTGTPEKPGQFVSLFSPPLYASLGSDNRLGATFNQMAPLFVVNTGQDHFADVMGLSPSGELISKFKLLPPEKPDFVFEAPTIISNQPDQWQIFFNELKN